MENFSSMFAFINVAIGVFALYSAVTGKGPAFKNECPESIKADANKLLRTVCWIIGPILVAEGVLEYLGYTKLAGWFIVPVVLTIIGYLVIFFKKYSKIARGKK